MCLTGSGWRLAYFKSNEDLCYIENYLEISVTHSSHLSLGDIWDKISPYWRLIPRWIRWAIVLGVTVALIVEPRILGWAMLGIVLLVLGFVALTISTPILSFVKAPYDFAGEEKPLGLVLLDWGTKPFRLADSAIDILEAGYEYLIGKG